MIWAVVFGSGCLFAALGSLLILRPARFLRLHDFLNPGSQGAEWRRHVHEPEYKFLGVGLLAGGLLLVTMVLRWLVYGGGKFE